MDKLAAGIMIALAALLMSGGFARDVMAAETLPRAEAPPAVPAAARPAAEGRAGLVIGIVVALEALRAAPDLLAARKG